MFKTLASALSLVVLGAALGGCIVTTDPTPGLGTGTLTIDWTLNGSSHPSACSHYWVDRVDVVLVDDFGDLVAHEEPYCEDFGISFELENGWYTTEVTLLDAERYAVSDTAITDVFVRRNREAVVGVDFPEAVIY